MQRHFVASGLVKSLLLVQLVVAMQGRWKREKNYVSVELPPKWLSFFKKHEVGITIAIIYLLCLIAAVVFSLLAIPAEFRKASTDKHGKEKAESSNAPEKNKKIQKQSDSQVENEKLIGSAIAIGVPVADALGGLALLLASFLKNYNNSNENSTKVLIFRMLPGYCQLNPKICLQKQMKARLTFRTLRTMV